MSYGSLSPEGRLTSFLHQEKTTAAFVGALAKLRGLPGLTQPRLSQVERGVELQRDAAKHLNDLMTRLERLRDALKPVPVRFWNASDINVLLELLEQNRLAVFVVAEPEGQTVSR